MFQFNATVDGAFCLRACLINHRSTLNDVQKVVAEVLAAGASLEPARPWPGPAPLAAAAFPPQSLLHAPA